jgi:hypothetical protein
MNLRFVFSPIRAFIQNRASGMVNPPAASRGARRSTVIPATGRHSKRFSRAKSRRASTPVPPCSLSGWRTAPHGRKRAARRQLCQVIKFVSGNLPGCSHDSRQLHFAVGAQVELFPQVGTFQPLDVVPHDLLQTLAGAPPEGPELFNAGY